MKNRQQGSRDCWLAGYKVIPDSSCEKSCSIEIQERDVDIHIDIAAFQLQSADFITSNANDK